MIDFYGELINPLHIVSVRKFAWPGKVEFKFGLILVTSDGVRRNRDYIDEQKRNDDYNNIIDAVSNLIKSMTITTSLKRR